MNLTGKMSEASKSAKKSLASEVEQPKIQLKPQGAQPLIGEGAGGAESPKPEEEAP